MTYKETIRSVASKLERLIVEFRDHLREAHGIPETDLAIKTLDGLRTDAVAVKEYYEKSGAPKEPAARRVNARRVNGAGETVDG